VLDCLVLVLHVDPEGATHLGVHLRGAPRLALVTVGYFTVWACAGLAGYALGTVLAIADRCCPALS